MTSNKAKVIVNVVPAPTTTTTTTSTTSTTTTAPTTTTTSTTSTTTTAPTTTTTSTTSTTTTAPTTTTSTTTSTTTAPTTTTSTTTTTTTGPIITTLKVSLQWLPSPGEWVAITYINPSFPTQDTMALVVSAENYVNNNCTNLIGGSGVSFSSTSGQSTNTSGPIFTTGDSAKMLTLSVDSIAITTSPQNITLLNGNRYTIEVGNTGFSECFTV
jgi:hypothetical protein